MPDRRRADLAALRLPRATGAFPSKNRTSALRRPAIPAARRPRHRIDEQAARLRTARWRDGHRRSERIVGLCRRRARLRIFSPDPEATRRDQNPLALQQPRESAPTRTRRHPRGAASSLPAANVQKFAALSTNEKGQDGTFAGWNLREGSTQSSNRVELTAADKLHNFIAVAGRHQRFRPLWPRQNLQISLDCHTAAIEA